MKIEQLQKRLDKVNEALCDLDCHGLSEFRKQRMLYDYQIQRDELEQRILRMQTESESIKQEVLNCIAGVPNTDWADTLRLRFIDGLPFKEIATKLLVAERTVYRWKRRGMDSINLLVCENSKR